MLDPHPSIRKAALLTVCSLDFTNQSIYLQQQLHDPALAVVKQCFAISIKTGEYLSMKSLEQSAKIRSADLEFFLVLFNYAIHIGGWQGLQIISMSQFAENSLQSRLIKDVQIYVAQWRRQQIYTSPTLQQFDELCIWLNDDKLKNLEWLKKELEFIFRLQAERLKKIKSLRKGDGIGSSVATLAFINVCPNTHYPCGFQAR
jgi:hypothetical protein